MKQKHTDKHE